MKGLGLEVAMERNSAACAMEWSIELEMGLRSKNHSVLEYQLEANYKCSGF